MQSPEHFRIRDRKALGSVEATGSNGLFVIPHYKESMEETHFFVCNVENTDTWEQVGVTVNSKDRKIERAPNFEELKFIKEEFWGKDETVVVYFPALFGNVPAFPRCQVLYRPLKHPLPIPEALNFG